MSDRDSSSDEAPEETTFDLAKAESKKRALNQLRARENLARVEKESRRARDSRFKSQKKLLSEVLQELPENESANESGEPVQPVSRPRPTPKKRVFEKDIDGVKVKLVKRRSTKLPPPKSDISSRKDQFLQRRSIPRR